jgi:hypothetical protein
LYTRPPLDADGGSVDKLLAGPYHPSTGVPAAPKFDPMIVITSPPAVLSDERFAAVCKPLTLGRAYDVVAVDGDPG